MLRFIALVLGVLIVISESHGQEQAYPRRHIRLVVVASAGGSADSMARTVSGQVESELRWNFVVDNRPGAAGNIGYGIVARAASDGYTLVHATAGLVISPSVYRKLPYDVHRDFTPITAIGLGHGYLLIVNPSVPARSLKEFIALARNKNSRLLYGSSGIGNPLHLAGATFNDLAGTHLEHVPYKGGPPVLNALLSGEIQVIFTPATVVLPHVQSGKMRALAFTGPSRWWGLPDVPTVAEAAIPGFDISGSWHAWFAAGKPPSAIITRLHNAVREAIHMPKVRDFIRTSGYKPDGRPPEEFQRFIAAEVKRYAEVARKAGIEPE